MEIILDLNYTIVVKIDFFSMLHFKISHIFVTQGPSIVDLSVFWKKLIIFWYWAQKGNFYLL